MAEIITDIEVLHKTSENVTSDEIGKLAISLQESIPDHGAGLAAIQIGIPKRIFLANLSIGSYIFVNPELTWKSTDQVPSTESCLSIPNVQRCIKRHSQVEITAEEVLPIDSEDVTMPLRIKDSSDAFIVQHEHDHLNGIIITDHEEIKNEQTKVLEAAKARKDRILKARSKKKAKELQKAAREQKKDKPKSISAKKALQLKIRAQKDKRKERTSRRQEKIRVKTEERFKAEREGLLGEQVPSSEPSSNDQ